MHREADGRDGKDDDEGSEEGHGMEGKLEGLGVIFVVLRGSRRHSRLVDHLGAKARGLGHRGSHGFFGSMAVLLRTVLRKTMSV